MKKLLLMLFALAFGYGAMAQTITYPNPAADLVVCSGSSLLTVQVAGGGTTPQVDVKLTAGVEYIANSFAFTVGTGIVVEGGTPNNPSFTITGASDPFAFTLERKANCGAYTHALSAGIFKDEVTVGATVEDDPLVNFYQTVYPSFTVSQPAPLNGVILGSNHTRSFSFQNNGQGCADTAYMRIEFQNGIVPNGTSIIAEGVSFAPDATLSSGNVYVYKIFGTPSFAGGLCSSDPAITITHDVTVDECSITPTNYEVGWGCDFANQCQIASTTGSATTLLRNPNLTTVVTQTPTPKSLCAGTPYSTITAVITNNGTGPANNISLEMGSYYNNNASVNRPWILDTASIMVNAVHPSGINVASNRKISNSIYTPSCAVGLPSIATVGNLGISIPPNGSITVTWNVNVCTGDQCGDGYYESNIYGLKTSYETECGVSGIMPVAGISSFGFRNYIYEPIPQVPAQVIGGQCFQYKIDVDVTKSPFTNPNDYAELTVALPAGMSIANLATDIVENLNGNNDYLPGYPQQVGQDVIVRWEPGGVNNFTFNICSSPSSCGPQTLAAVVRQVLDDQCPTPAVAEKCKSVNFEVVCPGPCPEGGVVPTFWTFGRTSFGQPDNNQDGLPDATGTVDLNKIDIDRYQAGDTLHSFYTGYVLNQTSPGTINNWNNVLAEWKFDNGTWTAGTADVTIKRGATSYVATGVPITVLTAGSEFVADWSSVAFTPALPTTYVLGDSVIVEADFVWTPPYVSNVPTITAAGTHAYMGETPTTGDADAPIVAQLTHTVFAAQTVPTSAVVNQSTGWTCFIPKYNANMLGNWNFIYANQGLPGSGVGCGEKEIGWRSYNRRLSRYSGGQYFLYEYRPMRKQDSIVMTIPAGWEVTGLGPTNQYHSRTRKKGATTSPIVNGLLPYTITGNAITGTTIVWDIKAAYDTNILNLSTEGSYLAQSVMVAPSCATMPSTPIKVQDYGHWQHYENSDGSLKPYYSQETRTLSYAGTSKPDVIPQNLSGVVQASSVYGNYWDIDLAGGTSYTAPYIWAATEELNGISVVSIEYPVGTPLTAVSTYGAGKDLYYIDSAGWAYPTSNTMRIYFTMNDCGPQDLRLRVGWNCSDFPVHPDSTCAGNDLILQAVSQASEIQLFKTIEPAANSTFDLCTPLNYEVRVRSTQSADIDNPAINVDIPAGMSVVANSFTISYPGQNNPEVVVVPPMGTVHSINFESHSLIDSGGIAGVTNAGGLDDRTAYISYQLQVSSCDFVSGSNPQYQVFANGICGDPATGDGLSVNSTKLIATPQAPIPNLQETTVLSSTQVSCSAPATATTTIISADTDTYTGDSVVITIPAPLQYVAGSFTVTSGIVAGSTTTPNQIVVWMDPQAGNTVVVEYDVEPTTSSVCDTTMYDLTCQVFRSSSFSCPASFGTCAIANVTQEDTASFMIVRPQLDVTAFTYGNTYSSGSLSYNIDVTNSGTADALGALYVIQVYCDTTSPSVPVAQFTSNAIAMGTTVNHTGSFNYSTSSCPPGSMLFATIKELDINGDDACLCNTPQMMMSSSIPLPITLRNFDGLSNSDGTNKLFWNVEEEINVEKYELERKTNIENDFVRIATIPSRVMNGHNLSYVQIDKNPSGDDLYRLRVVDLDGQYSHTKTVRLKNKAIQLNAQVSPNPAKESINLILTNNEDLAKIDLKVYDAIGRLVISSSHLVNTGKNSIPLNISGLADGNYIIQYHNRDTDLGGQIKFSKVK